MTAHVDCGDVLIAPPRIQDTRFDRAVIMLTHRRQGAAFGLCVNKPSKHTVADLTPELDIDLEDDIPLYWGGPVHPQTIWMLHSNEWQLEHTIAINSHWSMTSHHTMFHHLSDGDYPEFFRITFGFCGWARGQLDSELRGDPPWTPDSSWLTWANPTPHDLMANDPLELWRASTQYSSRQAVNMWLP